MAKKKLPTTNKGKLTSSSKIINFFSPLFYTIGGAAVAGATMGTVNVSVEILRKYSIFSIKDIFWISLWHMIIWAIIGAIIGILSAAFLSLRDRRTISHSLLIFSFIYLGLWLFVFGYVNIYIFAGFLSLQSIISNLILISFGIVIFLFLLKKLIFSNPSRISLFFKIHAAVLIAACLFSILYSKDLRIGAKTNFLLTKSHNVNEYNVILILLDAVRFDHLGCYGYERETSPNIDLIASKGVVFENAFAQSSHTIESVPSLFTSSYPSTHNVQTITTAIPRELIRLPEILKSSGYRTSIFSVNDYVSMTYGYKKGIVDFFGLEENVIKINKTVLGHLFYSFPKVSVIGEILEPILNFSHSFFSSEVSFNTGDPGFVTKKAMRWIKRNKNRPFFLYIHYEGGHFPYNAPGPYHKIFDPDFTGEPIQKFPFKFGMFLPYEEGEPLHARDLENMIAQYDGKIRYHDENLGLLLEHLKRLNLSDETIIIVTSDHGEEFYEHNGWGHGHSLYEEIIHVPLIFYGPELIPRGKRTKELVELVDIFPTVLSMLGISDGLKLSYEIEGIDLTPLFYENNPQPIRDFIFTEMNQGEHSASCLRTQKYKAIDIQFGLKRMRMFFDLELDPRERNNLYDKETKVADKLFEKLDQICDQAEQEQFKPRPTMVYQKLKKRLRSLGYIE